MNKSRFGINIFLIVGVIVVLIFALSVFSFREKTKIYDKPKITSQTPFLGEKGARVQIVEFGDFQCPYCAELNSYFQRAKEEYGDRVVIYWKDFPLYEIHEQAIPAAQAARCAQDQGKFWEMHDFIFDNQNNLSDTLYLALAEKIGIDTNLFVSCYNNQEKLSLIEGDIKEAINLGVEGTPYFYVNNYVITELPTYDKLRQIINEQIY